MAEPRRRLSDILRNGERERLEKAFDEAAPAADLKPIPPGEYRCRVTSGAPCTSSWGTPGYKLTFEVVDGEHAGRRVRHDSWITDAAMSFAKRDLAKLGITSLGQLDRPLPAGIIVSARVALRRGDDGSEFNRVARFDVVAVEPPAPDPFAPPDEDPADPGTTDSDGFDWATGEQRDGGPTP